uniref:Vestigial like family member 3 n=1 Tax=Sinocyclocheilus grahami TaxID=75366 RepID=A0A672TCG5_SINGR
MCLYSLSYGNLLGRKSASLKPRPEPELPREEEQSAGEEERCKETQPAEAEYLSARCVVFTYFRGDIGDVVDEHFSRALSQPSAFSNDAKTRRLHSGGPWKGRRQSTIFLLIELKRNHFIQFIIKHCYVPNLHSLTQTGLHPPSALPDSWHYGLGAQGGAGYPHVHEMYPHMHPRHPHPHSHAHAHHVLHHAHNPALDPRFSPLLLPGVRASCSPTSCADRIKTELEPSSIPAPSWPASFHGSVDIYHDTGETR